MHNYVPPILQTESVPFSLSISVHFLVYTLFLKHIFICMYTWKMADPNNRNCNGWKGSHFVAPNLVLEADAVSAPGQTTTKDLLELYNFRLIRLDAIVYGIIGKAVGHSKSALLFNAAFKPVRLNAVYMHFLVDDVEKFFNTYSYPDFTFGYRFSISLIQSYRFFICYPCLHFTLLENKLSNKFQQFLHRCLRKYSNIT